MRCSPARRASTCGRASARRRRSAARGCIRRSSNGGLASAVSGGLVPTQEPFLYTISVTATEGTALGRVEEATLARARCACARDGITRTSCRRPRHQLRARLVFENDSISNIAHQLGFFETIASWRLVPSLRRRIDAVTLDQVAEVGRQLPARRRTARSAGSIRSPRGDEESRRSAKARAPAPHRSTRDDRYRARDDGGAQRGLAPVRSVLDNGVRVIAKDAGATPAVTLHASFERGHVFDPRIRARRSAHFVSRTIDRGTATHTADEIAEELENRGVSLAITVNRHVAVAGLHLPGRGLRRRSSATLADIVMQPVFPDPRSRPGAARSSR